MAVHLLAPDCAKSNISSLLWERTLSLLSTYVRVCPMHTFTSCPSGFSVWTVHKNSYTEKWHHERQFRLLMVQNLSHRPDLRRQLSFWNLGLAENIWSNLDLCCKVILSLSQWNYPTSKTPVQPSAPLLLCSSVLCTGVGHWAGRGALQRHAPQRQPVGRGHEPSSLPSPCRESRGGMGFHASKTTSLTSFTDLFHYVDEPFTFSRFYSLSSFLLSPRNL